MAQATTKSTFALFLGNRGFFPGSLMASARNEIAGVLERLGHKVISLDPQATRHGGVETAAEGETYARFLKAHDGQYDGVILCLPNFGDENGAVAALGRAGAPILVQAYPDDLDKMAPQFRRDAFCGKISVMDVFNQNGILFTALKPHTVAPTSQAFAENVDYFDRVCRVVKGLKSMVVGAIGARTSAFKTVRIDEVALQRHGITVETFDLSDIFARMRSVDENGRKYQDKAEILNGYANFSSVPQEAFDNIARLAVALDDLIEECRLDAVALRCWIEMQQQLGVSPCVVLGELNDRLIPAACEVDVGSAVAMYSLSRASGGPAACLDWNNNYGDDENKCIVFHCGPVPNSMMARPGQVIDHLILANALGPGCGFGCDVGRIKPQPITFSDMTTDYGRLKSYVGEGRITEDPIPDDFFGCSGVAEIPKLQDVLLHIGKQGHRHHVSATEGHVAAPLIEALGYYLGFDVSAPQS
jgi:L-fucose isomerase-like protein